MLEIEHLHKEYDHVIFDDLNYSFNQTGMYVILGESGCGKSTLLHILGGLDHHYQGKVSVCKQNIRQCKKYQRKYVSFLFQDFNLIDDLKVKENYRIVRYLKKCMSLKDERKLIRYFKIDTLNKRKLNKISGGQKQRIALARTMLSQSPIILCDEPTGSLDFHNSEMIFELLHELSKNALVIVISHDQFLSRRYHDVLLELNQGKLITIDKKEYVINKPFMVKKKKQSYIYLMIQYFKSSFRLNALITFLVTISLICIMSAFSLSASTRVQIKKQVNQLIPATQIKVTKKSKQFISIDELNQIQGKHISQHYLENSQVEMLGLSKSSHYQEEKTIYLGDCTKKITENMIKKGRMYQNNHEIILSHSTYQHLKQIHKQKILHQTFYMYYQYQNQVKRIPVKVVGISREKTMMDTIYFKEWTNMKHVQELFHINQGDIAIIYNKKEDSLKKLKKTYKDYDFAVTNQQLGRTVDQQMNRLDMILICFSLLAIVSCCFFIGEVLYLIVIKNEHYFAILQSLGASLLQVMFLVYSQGIFIVNLAFFNAYVFLNIMSQTFNQMISRSLGQNLNLLVMNKKSIFIIYLLTLLLAIMSSSIPTLKIRKMDIIEGLKRK